MKVLGILLLIAGCCMAMYGFSYETTVSSSSSFSFDRVNNIGLLNNKSNYITFSGFLCLMGTLLIACSIVLDKIQDIITTSNTQNHYSLVQIRLTKKLLLNSGTADEEVDEIIEKGNNPQKENKKNSSFFEH